MDISFLHGGQKFNYRACAMIIDNGKILAMHDERSPYFYLPGGRVKLGETAEEAVVREVREELQCECEIVRPLWLNQAFFREDVDGLDYHELCVYFLVKAPEEILRLGERFRIDEGRHIHVFQWLDFAALEGEYFYPAFLKKEIFSLPEHFTIRVEHE